MELIDISKKTLEKLDACPVCETKLIQKHEDRLDCPMCGLHILLETQTHRYMWLAFMTSMFGVIFGFAFALILEGLKHVG